MALRKVQRPCYTPLLCTAGCSPPVLATIIGSGRGRSLPFCALPLLLVYPRSSAVLSIPAKNMLRSSPRSRSVSIVGGTTFGKPNSPEWSRMYQKDVPILKSTIQRVREAGGIVVACAVGICENEAYEVDHPAQDVRFCPRRPQ